MNRTIGDIPSTTTDQYFMRPVINKRVALGCSAEADAKGELEGWHLAIDFLKPIYSKFKVMFIAS